MNGEERLRGEGRQSRINYENVRFGGSQKQHEYRDLQSHRVYMACDHVLLICAYPILTARDRNYGAIRDSVLQIA